MDLDDLYNDLIMEHSMRSMNRKDLSCPTCSGLGHNPNCGDEIKLEVVMDGDVISDMAFSGHGCAISQSSTSIMIDTLRGKSAGEAREIIDIFMRMIRREDVSPEEKKRLGDARAFSGVANMPARAKCATLSWHTLESLLDERSGEEKS
ncbi:MAG: SUF system NifU family Fe-S cluster assembly protein [Clostridia bacterium]|nr:SUF system NifU family Fe-S cluster assembly protein [Clostridia bacterium]